MEKDLKKQHEEERKLLDKKIDNQNIRKQLLEQLQSEFDAIGESVTKCVDLASFAAQGDYVNLEYEDMLNENRHIEKNSKELFEDVTNDIQRKLDLYEERKAEIDKIYER
jgi:hypothetical protein